VDTERSVRGESQGASSILVLTTKLKKNMEIKIGFRFSKQQESLHPNHNELPGLYEDMVNSQLRIVNKPLKELQKEIDEDIMNYYMKFKNFEDRLKNR